MAEEKDKIPIKRLIHVVDYYSQMILGDAFSSLLESTQ